MAIFYSIVKQTFGLTYSPLNSAKLNCSSEVTLIYLLAHLKFSVMQCQSIWASFQKKKGELMNFKPGNLDINRILKVVNFEYTQSKRYFKIDFKVVKARRVMRKCKNDHRAIIKQTNCLQKKKVYFYLQLFFSIYIFYSLLPFFSAYELHCMENNKKKL